MCALVVVVSVCINMPCRHKKFLYAFEEHDKVCKMDV